MSKLVIKNTSTTATSLQSSLSAMIAEKKATQEYSLLLCDVSGSMSEIARGERKIETLARTVNNLVVKIQCKLIAFSDDARNVIRLDTKTKSRTNLAAALRLAKSHKLANQVIVISDGLPDSEEKALEEARSFTVPISCIYVGPGEDSGYAFLKELARVGRGKSSNTGKDLTQLNRALYLMLPTS